MQTISLEEAQIHLAEVIEKLTPGEEIVITRGGAPVAKLSSASEERPHPVRGRGRGMLRIISDDDDHLKDFAEYTP